LSDRDRIAARERRLEDLESRVREHDAGVTGIVLPLMAMYGLSLRQAQMLAILVKRQLVTRDGMMIALYGNALDPPQPKTMDVILVALRHRLRRHDIEIKTHWGTGWGLAPGHAGKINEAMRDFARWHSPPPSVHQPITD
jgi:hypothetical protein